MRFMLQFNGVQTFFFTHQTHGRDTNMKYVDYMCRGGSVQGAPQLNDDCILHVASFLSGDSLLAMVNGGWRPVGTYHASALLKLAFPVLIKYHVSHWGWVCAQFPRVHMLNDMVVRLLVHAGADVNASNGRALLSASRYGCTPAVVALINAGADPICSGGLWQSYDTPIEANLNGSFDITLVRELLAAGAPVTYHVMRLARTLYHTDAPRVLAELSKCPKAPYKYLC